MPQNTIAGLYAICMFSFIIIIIIILWNCWTVFQIGWTIL